MKFLFAKISEIWLLILNNSLRDTEDESFKIMKFKSYLCNEVLIFYDMPSSTSAVLGILRDS